MLNFPDVATNFPPEIQRSFISFRSESESFYLHKSAPLKNPWLCALNHNHDSTTNSKKCYSFWFIRYSNSIFSGTACFILISYIIISIKSLAFAAEISIENSATLILSSESEGSKILKIANINELTSIFDIMFLRSYMFWPLQQVFYRITYTWKEDSIENFAFLSCIWILIGRNFFKKVTIVLIYFCI